MSRKEEYKLQNEQFLEQLRTAEGIKELPCGILYRQRRSDTTSQQCSICAL